MVEDDEALAFMTKDAFETVYSGCYEVRVAQNGKVGLEMFKAERPDIVVADVDMPVMNGLQMTRHIREFDTTTPILFTSILGTPADVVRGFETGGNNYIKKYVGLGELHAYIQAFLRSRGGATPSDEVRSIGIFRFHPMEETLLNTLTDKSISLGRLRAGVLKVLSEHPNETVTHAALLDSVWRLDDNEESLYDCISDLRKWLKADSGIVINNLRGIGYKLEVKS